jgi:hypothetical protein
VPDLITRPFTGYYETEYSSEWPGLVTNRPSSRIPPASAFSTNAMAVRGRLNPQPAIFPVTSATSTLTLPTLAANENVCLITKLAPPGCQFGFNVLVTNIGVYIDYTPPTTTGTAKTWVNVANFPIPYPRYCRFGSTVIGATLYLSSASALGVYALRPLFTLASITITNPGGYFSSAPTVIISDGGASGATATATVGSGNLAAITLTNPGSGYYSPPAIKFGGGSATGPQGGQESASAIGILSANPTNYGLFEISAFTGVASVSITPSGTGYIAPQVSFVSGGGSGAAAVAILNQNGQVTGIMMTSPGQNYTSAPTVVLSDPAGTGASTPIATLFNGLPFIGGDFMTSMSGRLILANIIGGDGDTTTSVKDVIVTDGGYYYALSGPSGVPSSGSTYGFPVVTFEGGGGSGASAYVQPSPTSEAITSVPMGEIALWYGQATTGSPTITGLISVSGTPKIGQVVQNTAFASGTTITAVSANTLTLSSNSTATAVVWGFSYGFTNGDSGAGYYSTPEVIITPTAGSPIDTPGAGATAIAQLSSILSAQSTTTRWPDRVAWSAPNAPQFFDPNYLTAPGGFNTLAEARGLCTSINVIESVGFIGHNGGITEMTINLGSALVPFGFYPLWTAEDGVLVRYGSMAQYGSLMAFLANDSAYTLTPSGQSEMGQNIAWNLQAYALPGGTTLWQNGAFPLQGLYGSIVLIEGEKHYLIASASDDPALANNNSLRLTNVFDLNLNENSWNQWSYPEETVTCPITQIVDVARLTNGGAVQLYGDSWIFIALTASVLDGDEQALILEVCPLNRSLNVMTYAPATGAIFPPVFVCQFRTEAPSIARMQSNRRILIEYENQPLLAALSITPTPSFIYTGQEDPTTQTGTISQQQTTTQALTSLTANVIPGQILTAQADFGTFTGVCTTLQIDATGNNALFSLVRLTQIAQVMKAEVP